MGMIKTKTMNQDEVFKHHPYCYFILTNILVKLLGILSLNRIFDKLD